MKTRKFNEEVLFATETTVEIKGQDVESLKLQSEGTPRSRIRLCAHLDIEDPVHEMFIVHNRETYVRPHKHLNRTESYHVIDGSLDLILFDDAGAVTQIVEMGDYSSGRTFFSRTSDPGYHTVLITSEKVVFHETTAGPFRRSETIFAPWAPEESDRSAAAAFMERLRQRR